MPRDYDAALRFSDRVDDYARHRPGYPPALADWLLAEVPLQPGDVVADVGAGTGLFTRSLLAAGLRVLAVEPNAPMRAAAIDLLGGVPGFSIIEGTGEATGLPGRSVKLVTVAQAFHWFDPVAAARECLRVLVPGGKVALIWNLRRIDSTFARDYEALLMRHCADYAAGMPEQADAEVIHRFFAAHTLRSTQFDNAQSLDFDGLRGRLLSSSYTPKADDPARTRLLAALRPLFDAHAVDGRVSFDYDTRVFLGTPV